MTHSRKWCETVAEFQRQNHNLRIETPAQFLLKHGVEMSQRVPTRARGIPKACFYNAYKLASRRKNLRYVEGFANSVIPVEHAWCVDPQGRVVDPTWHEDYAPDYFGVPLDLGFVRTIRKFTRSWSVLFDFQLWPEILGLLQQEVER